MHGESRKMHCTAAHRAEMFSREGDFLLVDAVLLAYNVSVHSIDVHWF